MKAILLAIFSLILATAANAAIYEEQIFNEKITSSGTYTGTNGEKFNIKLIGDAISIDVPGSSLIVKNDSCEYSNRYDVCLLITEFSHYNYAGPERIVNKRDVTINARVAKLNLTREIEKTEFWIGEETEVKMRIQNIGERPTTVSFLDNFSDAFDVALPLACDLKGSAVSWKGELRANDVVTCNYRIKAAKAASFSSAAKAAYDNGVAVKTETDTKELTVKDFPLQLSSDIGYKTVILGSNVTATFNVTATENMTVKSLKVLLPDGLQLISWKGINKVGVGTFGYDGYLDAGANFSFTINFSAERTGILLITENASIRLSDKKVPQKFESTISVNVSVGKLYARIAESNFSSGANKLEIIVVNPTSQDFYNVNLAIDTELPLKNKNANLGTVSLLGHKEFSGEFDAQPGIYKVATELRYNSVYGEGFLVTNEENVTVSAELKEPETPKAVNDEKAPEAQKADEADEDSAVKEPERQERKFSAKAAIIATAIVVIIAVILMMVSARKMKAEEY